MTFEFQAGKCEGANHETIRENSISGKSRFHKETLEEKWLASGGYLQIMEEIHSQTEMLGLLLTSTTKSLNFFT